MSKGLPGLAIARSAQDLIELLLTMEEFAIDARYNVLPEIAVGTPGAPAGQATPAAASTPAPAPAADQPVRSTEELTLRLFQRCAAGPGP